MNASSTNPTTFINQTDHTNHTSLFLLFLEHDNQPKTACLSLSTSLLKKATQPPRTTVCIYTHIYIYNIYVWLIRLNRPTNDPPQPPEKKGKPQAIHHEAHWWSPTIRIEAHGSHLSLRIRDDAHIAEVGKGLGRTEEASGDQGV